MSLISYADKMYEIISYALVIGNVSTNMGSIHNGYGAKGVF
jgi:hypothetical protein